MGKSDQVAVCVTHLDRHDYTFRFEKQAIGQTVFDTVCQEFGLFVETEFFGLYVPETEPLQWLDPKQSLKKQKLCSRGPLINLEFGVRFFVSNPRQLVDKVTRYFFFLQLKNDLATGHFVCRPENAVRLCGLILQADLGDAKDTYGVSDLEKITLMPKQSEVVQRDILSEYVKCRGMNQEQAEQEFLHVAAQQELYGADLHPVVTLQGMSLFIGLSFRGLKIFDSKLKPLDTNAWSEISTLRFDSKLFIVTLKPNDSYGTVVQRSYRCPSLAASKRLWKAAVIQHTFFRRREQPAVQGVQVSQALKLASRSPHQRSNWHGRTEHEALAHARKNSSKRPSKEFERHNTLTRNTPRARTPSLSKTFQAAPASYGWDGAQNGAEGTSFLGDNTASIARGVAAPAHEIDFSRFERIGGTAVPTAKHEPGEDAEEGGFSSRHGQQEEFDDDVELPHHKLSSSFGGWNIDANFLGEQEARIHETSVDARAQELAGATGEAESHTDQGFNHLPAPPMALIDHSVEGGEEIVLETSTLQRKSDHEATLAAAIAEAAATAAAAQATANGYHTQQRSPPQQQTERPASFGRIPQPPSYSPPANLDAKGVKTPEVKRKPAAFSIAPVTAMEGHVSEPQAVIVQSPGKQQHGAIAQVAASEEHVHSPEPMVIQSPRSSTAPSTRTSGDVAAAVAASALSMAAASVEPAPSSAALSSLLDQGFAELDRDDVVVRCLINLDGDATFHAGRLQEPLGLNCGDLLKISGVTKNWWRATNVATGASGLIPSPDRFEPISSYEAAVTTAEMPERSEAMGKPDGIGTVLLRCEKLALSKRNPAVPDFVPVAPYELVEHKQSTDLIRPVIVLGPSKDLIIDTLIQEHPNLFHTCVPHTTRPRRDGEIDGADYTFVSAESMEADINAGLFAETVRYQGNLYGTSFAAIREASSLEGYCLLDVSDASTLCTLKHAHIFPVAIFLRPVSADVILQQNQHMDQVYAEALLESAHAMEGDYAPYFTAVIQNTDAESTYRQVLDIISREHPKPLWCPVEVEEDAATMAVLAHPEPLSRPETPAHEIGNGSTIFASETIAFERGPTGLGFSFSGGSDAPTKPGDSGIYVTRIAPGGAAELDGRLQFGDRIVAANGVSFDNVTNAQVVSVIKSDPNAVRLKVIRACVPVILYPENGRYGLGIRGGSDYQMPVTIHRVAINSPAARHSFLEVGQEITHVNGESLHDRTHAEILDMIRSSTEQLELSIHPRKTKSATSRKGSEVSLNATLPTKAAVSGNGAAVETPKPAPRPLSSFTEKSVRELPPLPAPEPNQRKVFGGNFQAIQLFRKGYHKTQDCATALLAANISRNRYKDILPYDDTRVMLQGVQNDYINANHVVYDMSAEKFHYIASQGPKEATTNHFWSMIWDQGCHLICMLTQLQERGRNKCHQYWPEGVGSVLALGIGSLVLVEEQDRGDFVVRQMTLTHQASGQSRTVWQAHFTAWPDHGVPQNGDAFLAYLEHVQTIKGRFQPSPVVLHCSAGIGRTGVYMVLEIALAHFQHNQPVDLPEMLRKLRAQRMGLVQTEPQYTFCYSTLTKIRRDEGPAFRVLP